MNSPIPSSTSGNTLGEVLVVDDNPVNLDLLQRALEGAGLTVSTATDGEACISMALKRKPRIILLDIMMPRMDGLEACRILRSQPETRQIPVIFISGKTERLDRISGLELGAVDYLTKPIDIDETIARVRTQLRLQSLFAQNQDLTERLYEARKSAALGAFARGVAHNLNNLLAVASGYAEILDLPDQNGKNHLKALRSIQSALHRIGDLVHKIDHIASADTLEVAPARLGDLLENTRRRAGMEFNVSVNQIQIQCGPPPDSILVTNRESFEGALCRLLVNASEASDPEDPVYLEVSPVPERAAFRFLIRDRGCGLPEALRDTLFDPFVTSKNQLGRGLGLTLARHTLLNLGAELHIYPAEPGPGTVAEVFHPASGRS